MFMLSEFLVRILLMVEMLVIAVLVKKAFHVMNISELTKILL